MVHICADHIGTAHQVFHRARRRSESLRCSIARSKRSDEGSSVHTHTRIRHGASHTYALLHTRSHNTNSPEELRRDANLARREARKALLHHCRPLGGADVAGAVSSDVKQERLLRVAPDKLQLRNVAVNPDHDRLRDGCDARPVLWTRR